MKKHKIEDFDISLSGATHKDIGDLVHRLRDMGYIVSSTLHTAMQLVQVIGRARTKPFRDMSLQYLN